MAPLPSPTKKWHTTSYQSISPSRPELSLSGKVVLITGGGTGIGARTARSYAEAGASHIAILGRRQAKLEETASEIRAAYPGTQIHTYVADMTDASAINKVFAEFTTAAKGKIDILISNAATGLAGISIATVSPDAWFSDIETNVKGPLHLTQAFLSGYGKKDGLIINITSGMSFLFGATTSSYAVSKEAGVRFFQIVGMENPELRIVHVQPGIVETDLNRKGSIPAQDDISLPADINVWLASEEAAFLKDKYIFANWDVEELKARKEEIVEKKLFEMWLQGVPFEVEA